MSASTPPNDEDVEFQEENPDCKEFREGDYTHEIQDVLDEFLLSPWREKLRSGTNIIQEALVEITPDLATTLLASFNPRNRGIVQSKIKKLRKQMERWNPDQPDSTIIFGLDGYLKNGQHRLTVAVLTGVPFVSRVEVGHPNDILLFLDQHSGRTLAQQAKIVGRSPEERNNYAGTKTLYKIDHEQTYFDYDATFVFNLIDNVYGHEIYKIVPPSFQRNPENGAPIICIHQIRGPLLFAALHWPEATRSFVQEIQSLKFSYVDNGAYWLWNFLSRSTSLYEEKSSHDGRWRIIFSVFHAFRGYLHNRPVTKRSVNPRSAILLKTEIDPAYRPKPGGPFMQTFQKKKARTASAAVGVDDDEDE